MLTIASADTFPADVLTNINNDIANFTNQSSSYFSPDSIVMITWKNLIPNAGSDLVCYSYVKKCVRFISVCFFYFKIVSFQIVFVTNYTQGKSYAIFNYEYGATWNGKDTTVLMGYTEGTEPVQLMFSNAGNSDINPYLVFSSSGNISKRVFRIK
jgi:hypothetical protein